MKAAEITYKVPYGIQDRAVENCLTVYANIERVAILFENPIIETSVGG